MYIYIRNDKSGSIPAANYVKREFDIRKKAEDKPNLDKLHRGHLVAKRKGRISFRDSVRMDHGDWNICRSLEPVGMIGQEVT